MKKKLFCCSLCNFLYLVLFPVSGQHVLCTTSYSSNPIFLNSVLNIINFTIGKRLCHKYLPLALQLALIVPCFLMVKDIHYEKEPQVYVIRPLSVLSEAFIQMKEND